MPRNSSRKPGTIAARSWPRTRGLNYHGPVSLGYVLRAYNLPDGSLAKEQAFSGLPIRIGRNALNDFQLNPKTVSQFHARIDQDEQGRLRVFDLGSKNHVFTRQTRTGDALRVDEAGTEVQGPETQILIGTQVWLSLSPSTGRVSSRRVRGSVLGNPQMLGGEAEPAAPQGTPAVGPGPMAPPHTPNAHQAPQQSSPPGAPAPLPALPVQQLQPPQAISNADPSAALGHEGLPQLPGLPGQLQASPGAAPLPALPGAQPSDAAMRNVVGQQPPSPVTQHWNQRAADARGTGYFAAVDLSLEELALAGLRELAESLAPGNELKSSGDVSRFVTKLHDAVDVFCKSFIPLREGHSQFVSAMDLQRAAQRRSRYRSPGYMRVEAATTPAQVTSALLDSADSSLDAHKAIEGIFADLMIHQVALLDGVMQGVAALLEDLSPDNIEQGCGKTGPFGNRYKQLWQAYAERYEELASHEAAYSRTFGKEFATAYGEYQRRKAAGDL